MALRRRRDETSDPVVAPVTPVVVPARFANSWATVPLRIFLAAVFLFAGYAKFTYPGFFSPTSPIGFRSAVEAAKTGTPVSGLMSPLADHASLFGHVTAVAEIAIGLGLLVGLLTRLAALGGMVLSLLITLSLNWPGVKEYTGSSGWYTSVDLAVLAALSVFLVGGAGPLSLERGIKALRTRHEARDDHEPQFRDAGADLEASRSRLRGDDRSTTATTPAATDTAAYPGAPAFSPDSHTQQLPTATPSGRRPVEDHDDIHPDVESEADPDPQSLWSAPRRGENQQ